MTKGMLNLRTDRKSLQASREDAPLPARTRSWMHPRRRSQEYSRFGSHKEIAGT